MTAHLTPLGRQLDSAMDRARHAEGRADAYKAEIERLNDCVDEAFARASAGDASGAREWLTVARWKGGQ